MSQRTRNELKSFFRANLVPTEEQFHSLIDSTLNLIDDNLFKRPGEPVSLQVGLPITGRQKILNLYKQSTDPGPAWSMELNPNDNDPSNPKSSPGLSITDGNEVSRLFITQSTSGQVGINTITPEGQLQIAGTTPDGKAKELYYGELKNNLSLVVGSAGGQGIGTIKLHGHNQNQMALLKAGAGNIAVDATSGIYNFNSDYEVSGAKHGVINVFNNQRKKNISLNTAGSSYLLGGYLGIGTSNPRAKLDLGQHDAAINANPNNARPNLRMQPATAGGSAEILFQSRVNGTSDCGYVRWYDDLDTYAYWGNSSENGALMIGTGNDGRTASSDVVVLKGSAANVFDSEVNLFPGGYTGIHTTSPQAPLSIGSDAGKKSIPDSAMHITSDCILFGGKNSGKQTDSAQIAAGRHQANSLNIIGMSSGTSTSDRRVDVWAEGGFIVRGTNCKVGIGTVDPKAKLHVNGNIKIPYAGNYKGSINIGNNTLDDGNIYAIRFGDDDTNQLGLGTYSATRKIFNDSSKGLGIHVKSDAEFSVRSTGWDKLFGVKGASGNAYFKGNIGINTVAPAARISFGDVVNNTTDGITWHDDDARNYGIHRTSGAWSAPNYQQLRVRWSTGIILDPGTGYGKSYVNVAGNGMRVTSGRIGIGTTNAQAPVSIATGSGKENGPDGVMHITNDCILFGGNNNGKESNSAQISAGKHRTNVLNIVGMSSNTSSSTRKVEMWAEAGFRVNGSIGIGTSTPKAPLHVATRSGRKGGGNFRSGAGHTEYWSIGCWEWVGAQGFRSWSDQRVKQDIKPIDGKQALDLLNRIELVDYQYIPEYQEGTKGRGVVAQDIAGLLPDCVSVFPETVLDNGKVLKDFLSVDYDWIFVTGMAALQEMSQQVQSQQSIIAGQEAQLKRQDDLIAQLESRITEIEKKLSSH